MHKKRLINFAEAINEAILQSMKKDRNILLIGLGVDDPKSIFETTKNLNKIFSSAGGFKKIREYPPLTTYKTRYGSIRFTDGVLTYKNRKF